MFPPPSVAAPPSRFSFLGYGSPWTSALSLALAVNFLFASGHDAQRCVETSVLCVMAIALIAVAGKSNLFEVNGSTAFFLLTFLALGLASTWFAYSFRHAINEWSSLLLLLIGVFFLGAELANDATRIFALLHWVGIACGLYSLKLLTMYAAALASGFQVDMHSLAVGFSNARFLNHTQTALLPLIVLLYLQAPHGGRWRKAWFMLAAFWWALLFVCEARATVLGLSVACVTAFALRRSHARPFLVAIGWTALAGIALYALVFLALPVLAGLEPIGSPENVLARTASNPSSDRNFLWKLAIQLIASHPWLGVGPQHFAHEGAILYKAAHPHDWLLQIAAEWGIPALLCLLSTVFLGARALLRAGARLAETDRPNQHILVALTVACTAIFVDGVLSGVLVMPQSRLAIVLVLGVACGWVRLQDGAAPSAGPARSATTRVVFMVLAVAGLCGLLWSVAPDIVRHAREEPLTPAELAANPTKHWPRLWEAGFF
jgi:putative inorganic carbon (HCO3(-)) transporter